MITISILNISQKRQSASTPVLADEDGNILVNNDNNKYVTDSVSGLNCWSTVKGLTEDDYDKAFSFDENINGEKVHVVTSKDAVKGWTLVGFISYIQYYSICYWNWYCTFSYSFYD